MGIGMLLRQLDGFPEPVTSTISTLRLSSDARLVLRTHSNAKQAAATRATTRANVRRFPFTRPPYPVARDHPRAASFPTGSRDSGHRTAVRVLVSGVVPEHWPRRRSPLDTA